jgi:hypothetical protein
MTARKAKTKAKARARATARATATTGVLHCVQDDEEWRKVKKQIPAG